MQRAPDVGKTRKPAAKQDSAQATGAASRAEEEGDSDDSDDGLGRIKPQKASSSALPAGLGQVFNPNNPLASKPRVVAAPNATATAAAP